MSENKTTGQAGTTAKTQAMTNTDSRTQTVATRGSENAVNLEATNATGELYRVNEDMFSREYEKFDNPRLIDGLQMNNSSGLQAKTLSFKQDYIVLIRKKLYYAANSMSTFGSEEGTAGTGHYLRTYKLDTFFNMTINSSVTGNGTCTITFLAEQPIPYYSHDGKLILGTEPVSNTSSDSSLEKQTLSDQYAGVGGLIGSALGGGLIGAVAGGFIGKTIGKNVEKNKSTNKDEKTSEDSGTTSETEQQQKDTEDKANDKEKNDTQQSDNSADSKEVGTKEDSIELGTRIKDDIAVQYILNAGAESAEGKIIAAKADFDLMDEIWVFGKSNFDRDSSNGQFNYNQIFFGYIGNITVSFNPTNGYTMQLQAQDQLKLLDLSYVTTRSSMIPGFNQGANGLDLRYSAINLEGAQGLGMVNLYNPAAAVAAGNTDVSKMTDEQKKKMDEQQNAYAREFAYENQFGGRPLKDIILRFCRDSGVPEWYLKDRIEPITYAPILFKLSKNQNASLNQGPQSKKRLAFIRENMKSMYGLIEFYADEEGNIVLKAPNYALGINTLDKNNMNLTCLRGSVFHQINHEMYDPNFKSDYLLIDAANSKGSTKKEQEDAATNSELRADAQALKKAEDNSWFGKHQGIKVCKYTYDGSSLAQICKFMFGVDNNETQKAVLRTNKHLLSINKVSNSNDLSPLLNNQVPLDGNDKIILDPEKISEAVRWAPQALLIKLSDKKYTAEELKLKKLIFTQNIKADDKTKEIPNENSKNQGKDKQGKPLTEQELNNSEIERLSSQALDAIAQEQLTNTLSNITDPLIPEIPPQFINSFSFSENDSKIFNSVQVNIVGDLGQFESGNALTNISAVSNDIVSMMKYGVRPMSPETLPRMGNRTNAFIISYMLCAKSLTDRFAGNLNMIEDSYIKVGNPIRLFIFDGYPVRPYHSQIETSKNTNNSTLTTMSTEAQNITSASSSIIGDTVTTLNHNDIENAKNYNSGTNTKDPNLKKAQKEEAEKKTGMDEANPNAGLYSHPNGSNATADSTETTGSDSSAGTISNKNEGSITTGNVQYPGATYSGITAREFAKQTQAQAIYYVTAINRSINPSGMSSMGLTLTAGRMMGKPSIVDYMSILYKAYFEPNSGFSSDWEKLLSLQQYYSRMGVKVLTLEPGDDFKAIATKFYGIDLSDDVTAERAAQYKEELKAWDIVEGNCDDEKFKAQALLDPPCKYFTQKVTGEIYKADKSSKSVVATFEVHIYDWNSTNSVIVFQNSGGDNIIDSPGEARRTNKSFVTYVTDILNSKKVQKSNGNADIDFSASYKIESNISEYETQDDGSITPVNKQLTQLVEALVALNTGVFGKCLNITLSQFNTYLKEAIGTQSAIKLFGPQTILEMESVNNLINQAESVNHIEVNNTEDDNNSQQQANTEADDKANEDNSDSDDSNNTDNTDSKSNESNNTNNTDNTNNNGTDINNSSASDKTTTKKDEQIVAPVNNSKTDTSGKTNNSFVSGNGTASQNNKYNFNIQNAPEKKYSSLAESFSNRPGANTTITQNGNQTIKTTSFYTNDPKDIAQIQAIRSNGYELLKQQGGK